MKERLHPWLISSVRSIAFNVLFYLNTLSIWLIVALPTFFMPLPRDLLRWRKTWGRDQSCGCCASSAASIANSAAGKNPARRAASSPSKHQSAWETFALLPLFDDPVFILKRELMWIPIFGWLHVKGRMIPVDRGARLAGARRP